MKLRVVIAALALALEARSAEPPTPGARFLESAEFREQGDSKKRWVLRTLAVASQHVVPRILAAESITVYSLDPSAGTQPAARKRPLFHGYPYFGSRTIRGDELRKWRARLIEGLVPAEQVLCFRPRHALRLRTQENTLDLVLCFECGKMRLFGEVGRGLHDYFFDAAVLDALNQYLDKHHISRDHPPAP